MNMNTQSLTLFKYVLDAVYCLYLLFGVKYLHN